MTIIKNFTNFTGTRIGVLHGKQVKRKATAPRKAPKTEGMKISEHHPAEFGGAASAGKQLRSALVPECQRLEDRHLFQHVDALMLQVRTATEQL